MGRITWKAWVVIGLIAALIFAPVLLGTLLHSLWHGIGVVWDSFHINVR